MVTDQSKKSSIIAKCLDVFFASRRIREGFVSYILRDHMPSVISGLASNEEKLDQLLKQVSNTRIEAIAKMLAEIPQMQIDYLAETLASRHLRLHFSQEGEDVLLQRIISDGPVGFFVDVGAHHPLRFSNTYMLYRQGWRGINIDATPGSMKAFHELRPEDINLEYAVSNTSTPLQFHCFKEPALNTFDAELAETYVLAGWERVEVREICPRPLAGILNEHLPKDQFITLMSIDVEGQELSVLSSNDWGKYAPEWLILEVLDTPLNSLDSNPIIAFLKPYGYTPVAKLCQSVILKKA